MKRTTRRALPPIVIAALVAMLFAGCPGKMPTESDPDTIDATKPVSKMIVYIPDQMWMTGNTQDLFGYSVNNAIWTEKLVNQQSDGSFRLPLSTNAATVLFNIRYGSDIQWVADKYGMDGTLKVLSNGKFTTLNDSYLVTSAYGDGNISIRFNADGTVTRGPGEPLSVIRDSVLTVASGTHFVNIWFQVWSETGGSADVDQLTLRVNGAPVYPPVDLECDSIDGWMSSLWQLNVPCDPDLPGRGLDIFTQKYLSLIPGRRGNAIRITVPEGGQFTEMYMKLHLAVNAGDKLSLEGFARTDGAGVRFGIDEYTEQSDKPRVSPPYGISGAYQSADSWKKMNTRRRGC